MALYYLVTYESYLQFELHIMFHVDRVMYLSPHVRK